MSTPREELIEAALVVVRDLQQHRGGNTEHFTRLRNALAAMRESPPPPKRVRAEVKLTGDALHVWWDKDNDIRLTIKEGYPHVWISRRQLHELAALDLRADKDGMVLEGETATPPVTVREITSGKEFIWAPPTETPALGTPGNPVTREQVEMMIPLVHRRWPNWVGGVEDALRAIGLEVADV